MDHPSLTVEQRIDLHRLQHDDDYSNYFQFLSILIVGAIETKIQILGSAAPSRRGVESSILGPFWANSAKPSFMDAWTKGQARGRLRVADALQHSSF
jgi:hypothetical protein